MLSSGKSSLGSYFREQSRGHGDGQNNHLVLPGVLGNLGDTEVE